MTFTINAPASRKPYASCLTQRLLNHGDILVFDFPNSAKGRDLKPSTIRRPLARRKYYPNYSHIVSEVTNVRTDWTDGVCVSKRRDRAVDR